MVYAHAVGIGEHARRLLRSAIALSTTAPPTHTHDGPRPGSLTRGAAAKGNGEGNDNCIRRTADVTTRFSHGRFPWWTSARPASRSSCVIHRALSVCPSGPIYIPPSSKLTFHRREEERRGGRASSRSIIRRTGASGGLGKVLRELSETQQWAPTISTGEQRVCMTLLTMIPPSGRVRRGSSEDEVISQFTNPPRGFRSRLPYNSPLHCPLPFFPIPAPSSEPHNWSNSLPSFIVWGAVPRKSLPTDRPPDDLIVALS